MPGPAPSTSPDRPQRPGRDIAWTDLPLAGNPERAPAMPKGSDWSARAKAWWKDAWGTPSSTQWMDRGDFWSVVRRAELEDGWGRTKDPKYLPEMRHLDAALGLTAKSRKELRWRIVDGDTVVEQNGEPKVADELAKRRAKAS